MKKIKRFMNFYFVFTSSNRPHPRKRRKVPQYAEYKQYSGDHIEDQTFAEGGLRAAVFYIPDSHFKSDRQAGGKHKENSGIGPEGSVEVQAKEGEAHAAHSAAGTIQACNRVEQAGDKGPAG